MNPKKIITIVVIVLVAVGFGYFLFSISPAPVTPIGQETFDFSQVKAKETPDVLKSDDWVRGNPQAKNVFIAYEDYQCPGCAGYKEILKGVTSFFPDTVFVMRYYPLIQIHKNAVVSAYAAEAAGAQGKYWEMHDLLFEKQADWENLSDPIEKFAELATAAGVSNIEQFKTDIISKKYKERIQRDLVESMSLNLPGTPSFYFNGHALKSDSLENMKKQAEAAGWMK